MVQGGKRAGAGRPKGTGKFGVKTEALRVPAHEVETVLRSIQNNFYRLPFYENRISAGFPSFTNDDIEGALDLNELLIKRPAATFLLRVSGTSMVGAAIHDGDILVVDRSLSPQHGKIVIASVNGELTVKRLHIVNKRVQLVAENPRYPPIDITEHVELHFWGVVTNVIHPL